MELFTDVMFWREALTVVAFVAFLAIFVWAWSSRRHEEFRQASTSVIDDNDFDLLQPAQVSQRLTVRKITMRGSHE